MYARGFGNVLDGQSIDLYSYVDGTNDNLISSLPINSGIAKYNYTGSGSGEKKFYLKKGSVVSVAAMFLIVLFMILEYKVLQILIGYLIVMVS